MKFLVVDDSRAMRMMVIRSLRKIGFVHCIFVEAADGVDALALFESERPDVLITDWHMKEMSGIELIRKIKPLKHKPHIGIVTSDHDASKKEEALKTGAEFILYKPFKPEQLKGELEKICVQNTDVNAEKLVSLSVIHDKNETSILTEGVDSTLELKGMFIPFPIGTHLKLEAFSSIENDCLNIFHGRVTSTNNKDDDISISLDLISFKTQKIVKEKQSKIAKPTGRPVTIPPNEIKNLLQDLLDKPIDMNKMTTHPFNKADVGTLAVFSGKNSSICSLLHLDLNLSIGLSGALSNIPQRNLAPYIKATKISKMMCENLEEIFNILSGLYEDANKTFITYNKFYLLPGVVYEPEIERVLNEPSSQLCISLTIDKETTGILSVYNFYLTK